MRQYRVLSHRGRELRQQGAIFGASSGQCLNRLYELQIHHDQERFPDIDSGTL